ncbi:DUF434 domain-containing protein [Thermodesulforhabdus norvegica]|uniref:DUF434 domain-containing protein n=1 Tax=Thermodesulforhabdus norvegica TaxID=39841 RepID=A0A1I4R6Q8_9BACT|nr:DUF434 domain-containing protein [Thermodesulforhabdus norvegica]SFM47909.1 hypothetical protein SAMN05660836_00431 [Thermodesulforhabdus norvegica]
MHAPLILLKAAAQDFFFLQSRGYPREKSLEMVGNRYELSSQDRDILRRGVFDQKTALLRRSKQLIGPDWSDELVMIDGHNVHITLESLLLNRTLIRANDGAIRDIARISRNFRPGQTTYYVIDLITDFFREYPAKVVYIFFDAPVSKSGELAALYRRSFGKAGVKVVTKAVPVPEREFDYDGAIIASSDSAVIDAASRWFDLTWFIMSHRNVKPVSRIVDFFDLIMMDVMSWNFAEDWPEACK